jgi:hypothetical protein
LAGCKHSAVAFARLGGSSEALKHGGRGEGAEITSGVPGQGKHEPVWDFSFNL